MVLPAGAEDAPGVTHFTLPNGLETVVIEDHRAPVVVQMVWYKVGSADEQPGKSGIAHYLEHLMFKGTDKLAPGELSRTVTRNGGMDNAFTSYDYTAYFQRIAADRLPLVMGMEADRMANLKISPDDWLTERDVVMQERAQRVDSNPQALFGEQHSAVQYMNHPYRRPVIGWPAEVDALTRDDAIAWYDRYYAPNNAILILAGDVTPEQARTLAEEYYGSIPARPDAQRAARPQEPAQLAPRRLEMTDARVSQPMLVRTVLAPERNSGDQEQAAALTILAALLGGSSQTSVLAQKLMLTGKAVSVSAGYDGTSLDPTEFSISMVPTPETSPEDAEATLDQALADFLTDGPDAAQLDRIKAQLRASRVYTRDSAHGRSYEYGMALATGLTVDDVAAWPDLLESVTTDQVMAAARQVLTSPASVTGWLLPEQEAAQ
ncbi:MAG: pitrilysin family protein [Paracoccus sp. (in: a-proteobacteria)]|uniref:M16 family metallopeptidase n=1 Tax=Paracoccus sp. TaxID=267 RepID=UPI0026E083A0|nr:pitrilysin family protein [Paracoccus sp. (in: a-proteobacteria)]MDO5621698.1 pitrilysin family protein [Paracoccus sp. (in: a-proteobacteria)]